MGPSSNLVLAWLWILLGVLSGLGLGMFFHREQWLGGYGSLQRRLYRLGHISFFGLGAVNLLFWVTLRFLDPAQVKMLPTLWASRAFIAGAVTMPLGCLLMAHYPKTRLFFAVPVLSTLLGCGLTLSLLV